MRLPVGERHPQVDHRVAGADTPLHLVANALLHRRDEVAGYGAADHLVHELEATALREGLDLEVAHGVLPVPAGLLHVASVTLGRTAERLPQRDEVRRLVHVHRVALGQPLEHHGRVRLAHAPQHQLVRLGVVLDPDRGVLGGQPRQRGRELVVVGLGPGHDRHGQQGLGHRPRPEHPRVVDGGERVARLRPGEPADGADVAGHHPRHRREEPAEGVGQRADLLVLVVVGVPAPGAEEGREVTRHVHGGVGDQRPAEHAHHRQTSDVGVARRAHDLGHQRTVGVAGDRRRLRAGGGEHVGRDVLGRGREGPDDEVEELGAADAGHRAHRHHRVEAAAGHGLLEVGHQHVLGDLLALEVAVHQGLVLGLLDDRLDEGAAQVVVGVLGG